MADKIKKELEELVKYHEDICSDLIGGFEYKELVAELRELLNRNDDSRQKCNFIRRV